jgi:glycosyltransferase involved in cell wall biosynthesis
LSTVTGPKRVLMLVGNDIRNDTRVLKTALALSDGGLEVTVLGYSSGGVREDTMLGQVRILRVPVYWRMRDHALRQGIRKSHVHIAVDPGDRKLQNIRATLRRREADELGGLSRRRMAGTAAAGRHISRVRAGLHRRLVRLERLGWRAFDKARNETGFGAGWRRLLREMDDYELAFAPVIDRLEWDVLHAHDVHMVGIASRAVARRRAGGQKASWVYDAHEFVAGLSLYGSRTRRKVAAYLSLESEYIGSAAGVLTVSEPLAIELQRRYGLPRRPTVVMNSPVLGAGANKIAVNLRQSVGLADDVPLIVYSGGVTEARGIQTAVEALPHLPGVHLAVVCVPHSRGAQAGRLLVQATSLGVADRLHLLDPVRPDEVSAYVASADVGLLPLKHFGSHEVALANKLFEYLYAGIPVLVSDCKAQADFVRSHGVGAVHVADDPASFAAELRGLLARRAEVAAVIAHSPDLLEPYAWERQEVALRTFYRELLGSPNLVVEPARASTLDALTEVPRARTDRPSVIGIGPANMAGQAWAWAKALERHLPGVSTEVIVVDRGSVLVFEADEIVPATTYSRDARWAQALEARALDTWTHALLEAGRPIFGLRHGRDFSGDVPVLRAVGVEVALLLHGSEVRNPSRHAQTTPWSPFRDPDEELTARLQLGWNQLFPLIDEFDGPKLVSTPDLLADVPGAIWLPVVVDLDVWGTDQPVMQREVPIVLHAPSRASIKGTAYVEDAMRVLSAEGLVDYRRIEGLVPADMPSRLAQADIVLDQFSLGSYGVLAAQAMAAGRVVVGHVTQEVRSLCPGDLPIVEATPDQLVEVVRGLLMDRDGAVASAQAARRYVADVHSGERSAQVLTAALGLRGTDPRT